MNEHFFANNEENLRVSIISPFAKNEIENHSFGGATLIWMQKRYFDKRNIDVDIIYLTELESITSHLLNFISKIRQNPKNKIKKSVSKRWLSNMIFWIFIDILSRFDFLLKNRLTLVLKNLRSNVLICNYPTFYNTIFYICKNRRKNREIKCILFEHNVEYYFFKQMLNDEIVAHPFINIWKKIERSAIKKSDSTLVVTSKDKDIILKDMGKQYNSKIFYWIPFDYDKEKYTKEEIDNIQKKFLVEDEKLSRYIKNKKVICFVGAYFEPNIIAVYNIIKIAENTNNKDLIFLILGKVCEAFNDRKNIPDNVIMKGFVRNLDLYLGVCNAFINTKTISDTGIEMKMFDYLKFGKQIISTEMGAKGFENFENIMVIHNGNHNYPSIKIEKSKTSLIVYVGRIRSYKQLDHLIRAFKIVRNKIEDSKLIIAGKGDKSILKDIAIDLGLESSVMFYDNISENKKMELLSKAWVFVIPSMKEGWGITVIEANSCGTPIIGYNVEGLKDSIKNNETGLLVRSGNIEELATSIIRIIENKDFREQLNKNVIKWSERFDWNKSAEELLKIM